MIDRRDLVAELDRAAAKKVTGIAAPAGSGKTSLLRRWIDRAVPERRIAFVTVRPGEQDAQSFWLSVLGAARGTPPPPASSEFDGVAVVDQILVEIGSGGVPFVLVIDDLHELTAAGTGAQLVALLTNLPPNAHAITASAARRCRRSRDCCVPRSGTGVIG